MPCSCGFTSNKDNTCDGNHKIVKKIKDSIVKDLEVFFTVNNQFDNTELQNLIIKLVKESK